MASLLLMSSLFKEATAIFNATKQLDLTSTASQAVENDP